MFCFKCGHKLPDDALYCIKCGAQQFNNNSTNIRSNKSPNEISLDHRAMVIYLKDIRTLEYALNRYSRLIAQLNNDKSRISTKEYIGIYTYPDGTGKALKFKYVSGEGVYLLCWAFNAYSIPYLTFGYEEFVYGKPVFISVENNIDWLRKKDTWIEDYCRICIFKETYFGKRKRVRPFMMFFENSYQDFKGRCEDGLLRQVGRHDSIARKLAAVNAEAVKVRSLLDKMYSFNILPSQFRNIHCIHYLYEFLSSSNQSLESAILHCDLNGIKQKLDKIIQQNEDIIINQSILMAQNQRIIDNNQEYLNKLASIERNTGKIITTAENASIYASIAASNAEACAFIGMAQYLK